MRTTLDLPDDLMRSIKVRAAQRDSTLTETITGLLRKALDAQADGPVARRVEFPLIRSSHVARPEEASPERIAQLLIDADVVDLTTR
ncbi:MAG: hypothetical protein QM677_09010 [Microbacterium sp.]